MAPSAGPPPERSIPGGVFPRRLSRSSCGAVPDPELEFGVEAGTDDG